MHNDVHDREFYRRMTHDIDQTRVRKKTLPLANLALCALLAAGFAAVSALHYSSNMKTFRKDVENVSELVSESMHQWINSLFTNVKYRIYSGDGGVQSVVEAWRPAGGLHELLQRYKEQYGVRIMLIDEAGAAAISSEHEGMDVTADLCDRFEYFNDANVEPIARKIGAGPKSFWIQGRDGGDCLVATRPVPAAQGRLIVESDTAALKAQFKRRLFLETGIAALIVLLALLVVNKVILRGKDRQAREMEERLRKESLTDHLTGLYNRRFMEKQLGGLIESLSRQSGVFSVLLLDVDFFKKYNDTYGHSQGDECLRRIAEILRNAIKRDEDWAARYGGEEFVVVLPNTGLGDARRIAEDLIQTIAASAISHDKSDIRAHVTVSIGGVTARADHTRDMEEYIKDADMALHAAKSSGRNRFCV